MITRVAGSKQLKVTGLRVLRLEVLRNVRRQEARDPHIVWINLIRIIVEHYVVLFRTHQHWDY